jgi:hypothetical protein
MSSITLHGASLFFGTMRPDSAHTPSPASALSTAAVQAAREQLLARAAGYEPHQPSYAADLRASALGAH